MHLWSLAKVSTLWKKLWKKSIGIVLDPQFSGQKLVIMEKSDRRLMGKSNKKRRFLMMK